MANIKWFITFIALLVVSAVFAQNGAPENWMHLDAVQDGISGVSTQKLYNSEMLKGKNPKTVIVAVIDSGVDPEHEDLKDVMWVNEDEIPGNGIDDDNNGYVDDIHGWNFIGGPEGKNVHHDTYEITRLYRKYKKQFEDVDPEDLNKKERKEYEVYEEYKDIIEDKREELKGNVAYYQGLKDNLMALKEAIGKEDITAEDLENFEPEDASLTPAVMMLKNVLAQGLTFEQISKQLQGGIDYFEGQLNYGYNPDFKTRQIIGDDYSDPFERSYGNNDVKGPDAFHGTHVAGIIAAERNNGKGMDGIANNVQIMSVRTVPDGDERDKDVANAIIYAVDNGASIINMSFGKGQSWDKDAVDKAVKYAMKNDVLLVHAAGNSAQDNDSTDNFPNDLFNKRGFLKLGPKQAKNWMEVGALSWQEGEKAPASFSNYGQENVDLFAPGVDIYSTTPDGGYGRASGTSMASPVTAGVAAIIRSYFPELTAEQVKEVLMESAVPQTIEVVKPGEKEDKVPFKELSVTGGVVNAYQAIKMAEDVKGKKKIKNQSSNGSGKKAEKDDQA